MRVIRGGPALPPRRAGVVSACLFIHAHWVFSLPGENDVRVGKGNLKRRRVLEGICCVHIPSISLFLEGNHPVLTHLAAMELLPYPGFMELCELDGHWSGTLTGPSGTRHFLSVVVSVTRT